MCDLCHRVYRDILGNMLHYRGYVIALLALLYIYMCILCIEISDLHKFVSVALHTSAGEGDLSSDKLSNLKIVGSGYGPLIYELQQGSSFSTFQSKCEAVWKAVVKTPKLPALLVIF